MVGNKEREDDAPTNNLVIYHTKAKYSLIHVLLARRFLTKKVPANIKQDMVCVCDITLWVAPFTGFSMNFGGVG